MKAYVYLFLMPFSWVLKNCDPFFMLIIFLNDHFNNEQHNERALNFHSLFLWCYSGISTAGIAVEYLSDLWASVSLKWVLHLYHLIPRMLWNLRMVIIIFSMKYHLRTNNANRVWGPNMLNGIRILIMLKANFISNPGSTHCYTLVCPALSYPGN